VQLPFLCECNVGFDCDFTKWVKPNHKRSPELFHDIVQGDQNGTYVPSPLFIKKACIFAGNSMILCVFSFVFYLPYVSRILTLGVLLGGYYGEYLEYELWKYVDRNSTLVIASEQLEQSPEIVWKKIALYLNLPRDRAVPNIGTYLNHAFQ
jgi:hypothetical protein